LKLAPTQFIQELLVLEEWSGNLCKTLSCHSGVGWEKAVWIAPHFGGFL